MKLKRKTTDKLHLFLFSIVFALCSICSMHVTAQEAHTEKITIQVNRKPVAQVFKQITDQCGIKFFYGETVISNEQTVTLKLNNSPLATVLAKITQQTGLQFNREGNTVAVNIESISPHKSISNSSKTKVISGTVVDETGLPVIGANIIIKGTTTGTITGLDGEFTLEVPEKSLLTISYIGYIPKELKVDSNTTYSINLKEDSKALGEVVVTALGIKREEKALGYSVQKIGGEELAVVKGTDVASSLTGKIAGLSINNSSEISEKPELKLRGESPLIVIDGIAYGNMSLSDISAEDIESIDVLKGATASALYGVRGRAGAVMITTKKSGDSGTLTVNVSNNTMFSAGYLTMPKAQSAYSTGNYGKLEYNSGNVWGDYMDGHEVEQYNPATMQIEKMPLRSKGKNNIANFFRPSIVTNTNVNISQAGELGGFRVSATQIHHEGQYPNTKLDKYIVTGGGNITYNKFKLDASFSYKKEMAPNMPKVDYGGGNVLYNMLIWGGTEYDIRDFKSYWKIKDQKQNWPFEAWYDNPYYIMNERINKQDKDLFNASLTMNYEIRKNLSVMFRSGYDNYGNTEENRQSIGDSGQKRGYYKYGQDLGSSFNNDLIINGDFKWNDITLDVIGGLSSFWYKTSEFNANTRGGLSVPGFYSLNASVERPDVSKSIKEKALYSIYGKAGISWKSGVYLDITGRNDWSSTLPASSRSYFYPSISTSILPTSFYNPFEHVLDFWKIRGSWTVAKKDMDVYDINTVYEINTDVWDGHSTATFPTKLRDPNIKPETETSYEIGTDFRFFNNRLGFDYTYFSRLRYDRLIESDISAASGSEKIITNTQEELRQKGMEFTLKGKPIITNEFEWEASFNGAFWHWYYHKLDPVYSSKDPRVGKGERYDKFFMTDWERDHAGNIVHQAGVPVKNKYETVMGYEDPKFTWGLSNRFTYKDLELNISIDGRFGGLMYSWTEQAMWHSGAHPDSDNPWRYEEVVEGKQNYIGQGVKVIEGSASYDPYGNVIEDTRVFAPNDVPVSYQSYTMVYNENPWDHKAYQNIKDATFIKLREIALNYTLPSDITRKLLLKNVRIGIIGQNLLMWTKEFKYSDPDRGKENLNSPTARYIGFNINLTL